MTSIARPLQFGQRRDGEACYPAGGFLPQRPRTDQRQRLRDIVAAGAHVGGAPGRQRNGARPFAGLLPIAFDQALGRQASDPPRRRRRHGANIDREEIAPGRQDIRPATGRRAGRAGPHEPAIEPLQQGCHFGAATGVNGRAQFCVDPAEYGLGALPAGIAGLKARHQSKREQFDPLHGIARGAPRGVADIGQNFGTRPVEVIGKVARQRIEIAQAQIERQRAMQRSVLRPDIGTRQPGDRNHEIVALRLLRRSPENMQAVTDLHFLEVAQMGIERA